MIVSDKELVKKSKARKKEDVHYNYTIDVQLKDKKKDYTRVRRTPFVR